MIFSGTHLSDYITVDFSDILSADDIGTTLQYDIKHNDTTLYNGQLYIIDNTNCKVYLNDIVTQLIDYEWFRRKQFNTQNDIVKTITVNAKEQTGTHDITMAYLVPNKTYDLTAADYYARYSDSVYPKVPSLFSSIPFSIVDDHSEYYIMWINRCGQFQCQPFCKNWEMKEKVTTSTITTVNNETIPYSKVNEFSWTLNSDWLTTEEHEEYEGLLASKYVYLYNANTQEGHFVNVKDADWTFKNSTNAKKPFNLTINLTKAVKQTMIY